jgi:hypothetical protein
LLLVLGSYALPLGIFCGRLRLFCRQLAFDFEDELPKGDQAHDFFAINRVRMFEGKADKISASPCGGGVISHEIVWFQQGYAFRYGTSVRHPNAGTAFAEIANDTIYMIEFGAKNETAIMRGLLAPQEAPLSSIMAIRTVYGDWSHHIIHLQALCANLDQCRQNKGPFQNRNGSKLNKP